MAMPRSLTPYTKKLARKTHRKSRLGCRNCKRRKIKVGGSTISAPGTMLKSFQPRYAQDTPSIESPNGSSSSDPTEDGYIYVSTTSSNFKPPTRAHGPSFASVEQRQQLSPPSQKIAKRPYQFTATDMALFHHLLTSKDLTAVQPRAQQQLCQLGFSHHYVLRLLLAFSGFNLVRKSDGDSCVQYMGAEKDYFAEADRHLEIAVQEVTALITQINLDNAPAMYASAVFIFLSSLAKGPETGEYFAFRDDGAAGYLGLFLGIRSIFELCKSDLTADIFAISGDQDPEQGASADSNPFDQGDPVIHNHEPYFDTLRELLTIHIPSSDPRSVSYHRMLDHLQHSIHAVLGPGPRLHGMSLFPDIFALLYRLPDDLVLDLQQRKPIALVLFSFFAVLLHQVDVVWFIRGWPQHIVKGIYCHLDVKYRQFIQWPISLIGIDDIGLGVNQSTELTSVSDSDQ
ncbi:transcription factor [Aspergillus melleus]|uniref:Transcription factor n=1 Tax=Aspergillus melleus TaxID=138277 RepID=A0ACC3B9I3_9EURO|nr:transcription factor [Aspergillus melleus]